MEYCYGATTSGRALGERLVRLRLRLVTSQGLVGLPKLTPGCLCSHIFLTWSRRSEPRSVRAGNIIQNYARKRAD